MYAQRAKSKHKRRWLQFSLRTLLLMPVLFALGWWWVTWPERTIDRFNRLTAAGEFDEREAMTRWDTPGKGGWHGTPGYRMEARPPTFTDLVTARRGIMELHASDGGLVTVEVVRNEIVVTYYPMPKLQGYVPLPAP